MFVALGSDGTTWKFHPFTHGQQESDLPIHLKFCLDCIPLTEGPHHG